MPRKKMDRVAIKKEVQRLACILGAKKFAQESGSGSLDCTSEINGKHVYWAVDQETATVKSIIVRDESSTCEVYKNEIWKVWSTDSAHHAVLVRALYCLGIEDDQVLSYLNSPLSAHEKMEARLSLPREFWPVRWSEEEGERA